MSDIKLPKMPSQQVSEKIIKVPVDTKSTKQADREVSHTGKTYFNPYAITKKITTVLPPIYAHS